MIILDGSYLEGGGQIVRTALGLSVLTGKAFEVDNIRAGREKPGLKAQHMTCVKALEKLCNAKSEGNEIGSSYLKFLPGKFKPQTLSVDIGTAGSITLLLQSLVVPCLLAERKTRLKITGGTSGLGQMPVDYFTEVFVPHLTKYADIECKVERYGYYPQGGGKFDIKIKPKFNFENKGLAPKINLMEQGNLLQIKGVSRASKLLEKAEVADRQAKAAKMVLSKLDCPIHIRSEYCDTLSPGSEITLWAIFSKGEEIDFGNPIHLGEDAIGERGKRSEEVGQEAAAKLKEQISSKAPVDRHMADNLIPLLGLFGGRIKVAEVTTHTLTNIYTVEKFLDVKFIVDKGNKVISVL